MSALIKGWIYISFWVLFTAANAQSPYVQEMVQDIEIAVQEPVVIHRINGSRFEGHLSGLIEGGFAMAQQVGPDGSVEVEFQWEEVESVQFAGEPMVGAVSDLYETGDFQGTILTLSPLFQNRSPFFRILPMEKLRPFLQLAASYVETEQPTEALGVIRSLKSWLHDPLLQQDLGDQELLCYLLLQLGDEAVALAKQQIESANDPSTAALSWIALSLHHLNAERYREAWLCAVHPILFDRRANSPDLADAYLVAMVATLRMDHASLALRYHQQFQEKELKLEEKSYQRQWIQLLDTIDWKALSEEHEEMETFADIKSRLDPKNFVNEASVPVLKIPLTRD